MVRENSPGASALGTANVMIALKVAAELGTGFQHHDLPNCRGVYFRARPGFGAGFVGRHFQGGLAVRLTQG